MLLYHSLEVRRFLFGFLLLFFLPFIFVPPILFTDISFLVRCTGPHFPAPVTYRSINNSGASEENRARHRA